MWGPLRNCSAFPDGDLVFEGVDQVSAGGERFGTMRCCGCYDDGEVADGQLTGAVYRGWCPGARRRPCRRLHEVGEGGRVGGVFELGYLLAGVVRGVVTYGSDE